MSLVEDVDGEAVSDEGASVAVVAAGCARPGTSRPRAEGAPPVGDDCSPGGPSLERRGWEPGDGGRYVFKGLVAGVRESESGGEGRNTRRRRAGNGAHEGAAGGTAVADRARVSLPVVVVDPTCPRSAPPRAPNTTGTARIRETGVIFVRRPHHPGSDGEEPRAVGCGPGAVDAVGPLGRVPFTQTSHSATTRVHAGSWHVRGSPKESK